MTRNSHLTFSASDCIVSPLFFPNNGVNGLTVYNATGSITIDNTVPHCLSYNFVLRRKLPVRALGTMIADVTRATHTTNVTVIANSAGIIRHNTTSGLFVGATNVNTVPTGVR